MYWLYLASVGLLGVVLAIVGHPITTVEYWIITLIAILMAELHESTD